jgi:hypothetical protein
MRHCPKMQAAHERIPISAFDPSEYLESKLVALGGF